MTILKRLACEHSIFFKDSGALKDGAILERRDREIRATRAPTSRSKIALFALPTISKEKQRMLAV